MASHMMREVEIGPVPRRWAVLLAFSSLTAVNNIMWISFAPVRDGTAAYFDVSSNAVDWLSTVFMLSYFVVFAPMSWYARV